MPQHNLVHSWPVDTVDEVQNNGAKYSVTDHGLYLWENEKKYIPKTKTAQLNRPRVPSPWPPYDQSMMRRRRSTNDTPKKNTTTTTENDETCHSPPRPLHPSIITRFSRGASLLCSVTGTLWVVYGFYLNRTHLYTHQECDMTWSHPVFVELGLEEENNPHPDNSRRSPYRLFQFLDRRDLRVPHKVWTTRSLSGETYDGRMTCLSTTAVLYIPGHGGSYQQARSLGAHGTDMTRYDEQRIFHALLKDRPPDNDTSLRNKFVYDVYAVDFNEEPSGLHGALILEQAEYVSLALRHIAATCPLLSQIVLVGHSMGGHVAQLAAAQNNSHLVRTIITLATPLVRPVLMTQEPTLWKILETNRQWMNEHPNHVALVSISGGLRDEMIPPHYCRTTSKNGWSILATDLMVLPLDDQRQPPTLGMDHRAIVWCHNLLKPLRAILHTLSMNNHQSTSSMDRLRRVQERLNMTAAYDYEEAVDQQWMRLQVGVCAHTVSSFALPILW